MFGVPKMTPVLRKNLPVACSLETATGTIEVRFFVCERLTDVGGRQFV